MKLRNIGAETGFCPVKGQGVERSLDMTAVKAVPRQRNRSRTMPPLFRESCSFGTLTLLYIIGFSLFYFALWSSLARIGADRGITGLPEEFKDNELADRKLRHELISLSL